MEEEMFTMTERVTTVSGVEMNREGWWQRVAMRERAKLHRGRRTDGDVVYCA
ncbi:hypothetical protein TSUD_124100 [Trifolium subterraneum]|uniref:Uncharacterized protein n=1 Tax=Trifolium subterraneum TaxID=3900 RepID=A0A2Z6NPV8_TRISU|nr:hypothetical protein TSUD_124100 [Trifolium subterraneum]